MSARGIAKPKLLLYILHSGNLYGTERMALATLAGLDEYDRMVILAPLPGSVGSVHDAARAAGHESVVFDSRWSLIARLLPWFRRYREIDVIGTGVAHNYLCWAIAKLTGVKLRQLQVAHGGTEDQVSFGKKRHLRWIPVRLVAVSDFVKDKLVKHGVPNESITVIDNFMADARRHGADRRPPYDPALPDARPVDPAAVKIAVVSRVDPIKRIDLLIEAVRRHRLAEYEFDVFGTGSELDRLRRLAAPLANLRLHGFVPDVEARLAASDFLLHLCAEEPFGLAILEAFRAGVVAIVPDRGGAGNLIDDGATGLRFRSDDLDDLVRVLEAVRTLPGRELQRIADAGNAALDARFSQQEGIRRYRQALIDSEPGRARRRPPGRDADATKGPRAS